VGGVCVCVCHGVEVCLHVVFQFIVFAGGLGGGESMLALGFLLRLHCSDSGKEGGLDIGGGGQQLRLDLLARPLLTEVSGLQRLFAIYGT
jgi:hypothetical protein